MRSDRRYEVEMNFIDAVQVCFAKYANFKGCASRPEFWWWFVFTLIVTATLRALSYNLAAVFSFATFLPSIAVTARRLHDIDRSGWWQLLYFFPVIGWLVLIFFLRRAYAAESIHSRDLKRGSKEPRNSRNIVAD
jgi:uncharacterized membrane protein YhaH (DUF805 family)